MYCYEICWCQCAALLDNSTALDRFNEICVVDSGGMARQKINSVLPNSFQPLVSFSTLHLIPYCYSISHRIHTSGGFDSYGAFLVSCEQFIPIRVVYSPTLEGKSISCCRRQRNNRWFMYIIKTSLKPRTGGRLGGDFMLERGVGARRVCPARGT